MNTCLYLESQDKISIVINSIRMFCKINYVINIAGLKSSLSNWQ